MTANHLGPKDIYNFPLDVLDATFMLHCHDNKFIYTFRREEIPGKLIIYKISGATIGTQNKFIGEVRFQFISDDQTRISYNTPRSLSPTWDIENWVDQDRQYLQQLCKSAISDLALLHSNGKTKRRSYQHGKLPLSQDETIRRIAAALLEEDLKKKDKGMTRGEVVVIAQERLSVILKDTEIKDGKKRLDRARHKKNQILLDFAQELLNSWLQKPSS